jgi:hypothetical protein
VTLKIEGNQGRTARGLKLERLDLTNHSRPRIALLLPTGLRGANRQAAGTDLHIMNPKSHIILRIFVSY